MSAQRTRSIATARPCSFVRSSVRPSLPAFMFPKRAEFSGPGSPLCIGWTPRAVSSVVVDSTRTIVAL